MKQDGDGDHQPGQRTGNADIVQDAPVFGRRFELDEGAHGAKEADGQGDEVRQGDIGFVVAGHQVVAELVGQEDGEDAEPKGDASIEVFEQEEHLGEGAAIGQRAVVAVHRAGEDDAEEGEDEEDQVDPGVGGFGVEDAIHHDDDVGAPVVFFLAEEGGDVEGFEGFAELVVGLRWSLW